MTAGTPDVYANVVAAYRSLERVIICRPELVDRMRAVVEAEAPAPALVTVLGDPDVPAGTAYLMRPGVWPS